MNVADSSKPAVRVLPFVVALVALTVTSPSAEARNAIRDAFFAVYPNAVGTPIETVDSQRNHPQTPNLPKSRM